MSLVKIFDSFYTPEELNVIFEVLEEIQLEGRWNTDEEAGSARFDTEDSSVSLRKSKALWLGSEGDQIIPDSLHRVNKILLKPFLGATVSYATDGLFEKGITLTNNHTNLLNYYENGGSYASHMDASHFTIITWFHKEPKAFEGGHLFFEELGEVIAPVNNRMIIFPGQLLHAVTPVAMLEKDLGKGLGRYSITQFLRTDVTKGYGS